MTEGYNRNYDDCCDSNEEELVEVDENISNVNGLVNSRERRKRQVSITKEKLKDFIRLYELNYKNKEIQAALNLSYSTVVTLVTFGREQNSYSDCHCVEY